MPKLSDRLKLKKYLRDDFEKGYEATIISGPAPTTTSSPFNSTATISDCSSHESSPTPVRKRSADVDTG